MIANLCCCSNIITNDKITNDKIMLPRQLASGGSRGATRRPLAQCFSSVTRVRQLPQSARCPARLVRWMHCRVPAP